MSVLSVFVDFISGVSVDCRASRFASAVKVVCLGIQVAPLVMEAGVE